MSVTAPPGQSAKLIEAAAAANLAWVIPDEFGADPTEEELQKDIISGPRKAGDRALIEKLRKNSWVPVVCSFWYEYSFSGGPDRFGFDFQNRTVSFFDQETQKVNSSTWPQAAPAVAHLLSLKVLPDDASDKSVTLSQFRNKPLYVSSFLINQKEMLESVLRVTGKKESDWKIGYEATKTRFAAANEQVKGGDRRGWAKLQYSRLFYQDGSGNFEARYGLHNNVLGLPDEDLNEFTKIGVKRAET
ncbi:hypothetical protein C8J56DRAFT_1102894 [Mycena floridula]|nr:hypothetical protein C8J56DRAFT_1102894 [Mycena floridula]